MKVLIADDHSMIRTSIRQLVEGLPKVTEIHEANDGDEALAKIKTNGYGFIVLDISLPGISGLEVLKAMKDANSKSRVLVISFHKDEQYALRAINLGAKGYISKSAEFEDIKMAVRKVYSGGQYVSPQLAENLIFDDGGNNKLPHEKLSDREFQVFAMLAKGLTPGKIAAKIFISPKTASTYKSRVYKKMGFSNNSELILYAVINNLVE
jgi:two-component system invasion response regulator UvrY